MVLSQAASLKLWQKVNEYLQNCYIAVSIPHPEAQDLFDFLQKRNNQVEKLSNLVKENVSVDIPPRYLNVIEAIIDN